MKITKASWHCDENNLRLTMPLSKIDQKNRLVSGFATLDNIDSEGDVVLAEASARAFARARGNLREMHQPIAVGRIVDFREDEFYDSESNNFYRGINVTARISEGAESTWMKVLDGTLSGFSIGGAVIEASNEFVKDSNRSVRFIKDYNLEELSLVDNPANQLANIFSIQKAANGSVTVNGMVADTVIENVFFCDADDEFQAKSEESATCLECGSAMENIGWFESDANRVQKVSDIIAAHKQPSDSSEGGEEMGLENDNVDEQPVPVESEAPVEIEESSESNEPAEAVDELVDDEDVIAKRIVDLQDSIHSILKKGQDETAQAVNVLEVRIEEIHNVFMEKASELENKLNEFGTKFEVSKNKLAELEKGLDTINSSSALRKSSDYEEPRVQNKPTWGGAFSVDNLL